MTTETQRTQALMYAGDLLEEIAAAGEMDLSTLKQRAQHLLRHYPSNMEIGWIAQAASQNNDSLQGPVLDPAAIPVELQKGYRRW